MHDWMVDLRPSAEAVTVGGLIEHMGSAYRTLLAAARDADHGLVVTHDDPAHTANLLADAWCEGGIDGETTAGATTMPATFPSCSAPENC
jgi:hypothetical protein